MPALSLFIDVQNRQFVQGFSSSIPASLPPLYQGDTLSLYLRFLQATGNSGTPYTDIDYSAAAVEVAIGTISGLPTAGTFTLTDPDAGQTTGAIAYNASASTVQAAIQAALTTNWSTATVTGSAGGPWVITNGSNSSRSALQGGSGALTPLSSVVVGIVQQGSGSLPAIQFFKLAQNPIAYTGTFTATSAAAAVVARVQAGSGTQNEVQAISLTNLPYSGTFNVNFGGQTSAGIAYNASPSTVQAALQAMTSIGSGNCTVSGSAGAWVVTFTGTKGLASQSLMTTVSSLVAPLALTGTLGLNTGSLEEALGESLSISQTIAIQVTPSGGAPLTAVQGSISIFNDLIENAVNVPAGGPTYISSASFANTNPTALTLSAAGSQTVAASGTPCNIQYITANAGSGAYTNTSTLGTTGARRGDITFVIVSMAASTNPTIDIAGSSTEALVGNGNAFKSLLMWVFNGTSWDLFFRSA